MQIFINNESIDFSLENEKTIGEVFDSMDSWLGSVGFMVTDFLIDGENTDIHGNSSWRLSPIDDIQQLNISAAPPVEIQIRHMTVSLRFISGMRKALETNDTGAMKNLSSSIPGIIETMGVLFGNTSDETICRTLETVFSESGLKGYGTLNPAFRPSVDSALCAAEMLLKTRMEELSDPPGQIAKTISYITALIPDLNNVSVSLQTGKDREAMNTVIRFIESSQKLLRLFSLLKTSESINSSIFTIEGSTLSEYYTDLNTILNQLIEAFEAKDSVLIGDLLEYEITPRLEKLSHSTRFPQREKD